MSSDTLQQFADRLREAGLVVDRIEADGVLHRCGVLDKPSGTDGSFKAFLDAPASIWWKNWRTGDEGTWCEKSGKDMTTAEREALKARIAEAKEATAKEQAERYANAAELAGKQREAAHAATDAHLYLARKEVPAFGLRQAQDGRLMAPVLDAAGTPQSIQFIAGDGSKRFLSGGKTAGGHFPIPAKDGGEDGPLLIAEGYATGASLRLSTGFAVLVAFNAENLEAVARMARKRYAGREIVLCADNDVETRKPDGTPWNPGVEAATKAAASIGGKLAICPAHEGRATDFNDLHRARSLEAVRQAVEKARREDPGVKYPEGYRVIQGGKNPGLYRDEKRGEDYEPGRIAPPLRILGRTKSVGSDNWGTLLQWFDPAGKEHRYALPDDVLQRQGNDWAAALAYQGYSIRRGKSNAFAISARLGLDPRVIETAKQQMDAESIRFEDVLTQLEIKRQQLEKEKEEIDRLHAKQEEDSRRAREFRAQMERAKENARSRGEAEAKRILADAKSAADAAFRELDELRKAQKKQLDAQAMNEKRVEIVSELNAARERAGVRDESREPIPVPSRPIRAGDLVEIPGTNRPAEVTAVKGDRLVLKAGVLSMTVKNDEVRLIEDDERAAMKKPSVPASPTRRILNTAAAARELDLRGMETLEAESVLENYLDAARRAHLETVTIIHGKGTGALRKAVQAYLRRDKTVKSFRLGNYGEGESGVTVVEFK